MKNLDCWNGFIDGGWKEEIDVRDFIQKNYTPYLGNESFLEGPSQKTSQVWKKSEELIKEEIKKGIIDIETNVFSGIDNFEPGYIDKSNEVIIGFQTDSPLKRIVNPYGGYKMMSDSLKAYGYSLDEKTEENLKEFRKTHNDGVFDAYTPEMRTARSVGILTGLPDAYGRGRIIGDYRRIPLYGVDFLVSKKQKDLIEIEHKDIPIDEKIRLREEVSMQIRSLGQIKSMASKHGYDISKPAENSLEAVQFLYFGYLAAIKENNGAAMSLGRNTTFLDIYIKRDMDNGTLNEHEAQELIDQLVIKLRMVRHLRTPDYNHLFAGDPTWVTESIGGMGTDDRTLVTKTSYRFLNTLNNLGSAPEPNMTILWSESLPNSFKRYCSKLSIETGAIQYENDDIMKPIYGDDYAIACCVSAMGIGKSMQFFGARANLAKALLYALNDGVDELKTGRDGKLIQVVKGVEKIKNDDLDLDEVMDKYKKVLSYLAKVYADTMSTIHYMHDKYAYEAGQMALHDTEVHRYMAFGIAGISIVADSLSAIKFAKVKAIRDENGIAYDFKIEGEYPAYGNDDDRVDVFAVEITEFFMNELRKHKVYRDAEQTLSVLTITSNVVYGKKTGATPDGRQKGAPFAPGANPMHGRDKLGALASLNSVAKLRYKDICQDGISNTFSIVPGALGREDEDRYSNLSALMDGYFAQGAFHLNVNVLSRDLLVDAMDNPDKYPTLTIRVSGYAVHFNRLTKEQQLEVISRTYHRAV